MDLTGRQRRVPLMYLAMSCFFVPLLRLTEQRLSGHVRERFVSGGAARRRAR